MKRLICRLIGHSRWMRSHHVSVEEYGYLHVRDCVRCDDLLLFPETPDWWVAGMKTYTGVPVLWDDTHGPA